MKKNYENELSSKVLSKYKISKETYQRKNGTISKESKWKNKTERDEVNRFCQNFILG